MLKFSIDYISADVMNFIGNEMKQIKTYAISMATIALASVAFAGNYAFAQNESSDKSKSHEVVATPKPENAKSAVVAAPVPNSVVTNSENPTTITAPLPKPESGLNVIKGINTQIANPFANDPDVAAANAAAKAQQQAAPVPQKPLTKEEIAKQIAPDFDVEKNYNRFVQCYGTLDFMSAFMEVRAKQPNTNKGLKGLSSQLSNLKNGLQPFVLATSTLKTEEQFRKDYSAVSDKTSDRFFNAKNPEAELQGNLKTINSCQQDARKWAGVKETPITK